MFTENNGDTAAGMKYLDLHGERVAYLDEGSGDKGSGEAILLLHGILGSSQTWRSVIGPLARKYRVVAPDLLGHGNSTKPRIRQAGAHRQRGPGAGCGSAAARGIAARR
jgi:pimeloyl-ACP methyl ester carboxylesterase